MWFYKVCCSGNNYNNLSLEAVLRKKRTYKIITLHGCYGIDCRRKKEKWSAFIENVQWSGQHVNMTNSLPHNLW